MSGQSRKVARTNARRLRSTIQRAEQQPYDLSSSRRPPRPGGGPAYLVCRLSSSLGAATGTWPNLTAAKLTGQQIYRASYDPATGNYALTALASASSTVVNYSSTAFATGKTTQVASIGIADAFATVVQDC